MKRSRAFLLALALAGSVPLAGGVSAGCNQRQPNEAIPGVRLGMTPRDVRDRFEGAATGSWQTRVGGGAGASDDTVLEWSAGDAQSRATHARFEFHLGMLVAIRAHLREPVSSESVDVTPKTVTLRAPGPAAGGGGGGEGGAGGGAEGGSEVTILARDCPTHREESDALVAKGAGKHGSSR